MDSRIHFGEEFSFSQQEKELQFVGSWIPVTPDNPVPIRANSMPIDRHESQLGGGHWQELVGFSGGYVQEMSNYSSVTQHVCQIDQVNRNRSFTDNINDIAGSYTQALLDENANWNSDPLVDFSAINNAAPIEYPKRTLDRNISMAERPYIPNLNTPIDSLREFNSGELFFTNQAHCSSSNLLTGHNSTFQIPQYGFPIPYNPNYNLNSPSIEADTASTVTNLFQFTPIMQQAEKLENQLFALVNFPQEQSSSEEKDKQDNLVASIDNVPNQQNPDKLLHNIVDSSVVISTPFEEPIDLCMGSNQVIDLNKTPQQKTPKQRKHRPKVIREQKPKRTPKATTTKIADPKEKATEKRKYVRKGQQELATQHSNSLEETSDSIQKPKAKRKYVRKTDLKEPETPNAGNIGETTNPSSETTAPSCRRALHFGMENTCSERERNLVAQQEILNKQNETANLSTGFHIAESLNRTTAMCRTKSDLQMKQHNGSLSGEISNLTPPMKQISNDNQSISGTRESEMQLASRKYGRTNIHAEAIDRGVFPAKTNWRSLEKNEKAMPLCTESVTIIQQLTGGRGYMREYDFSEHGTGNRHGNLFCQERLHADNYQLNALISSAECSNTCKKQKIEHRIQDNINNMPPPVAALSQSRGKRSNIDPLASTVQRNRELLKQYNHRNNVYNSYTVDSYTHSVAPGQDLSMQHKWAGHNSCIERTGENYNIHPPTPPKMAPQPRGQNYNINASKEQAVALTQSLAIPSRKDKMLHAQDVLKDQQSAAKRKGRPAKQKFPVTIEEIIYRMEHLNLNDMEGQEQTALVPYKGDGTLIPYEGSEVKKRKPRPKVDLDQETERVWKLLMWKEGGEGLEGTDPETNQRWEEERRIFHGRADSFIARMHLVQGDRRFSKWKGSVVDSVIGVFLTQNVSDHLSSSAFMHLAAKFPPKLMRNGTCKGDGSGILIQEPDTYMPSQNDNIKWHEKLVTPIYNQSSLMPHESMEHWKGHGTSRTSIIEAHSHNTDEEVLSSQDSFGSSVVQSSGGIRSHSDSNSEVEDPAKGCKHNKNHSFTDLQKSDSSTLFEDFYTNISGRSLFLEGSTHGHRQPEVIEDRWQWSRLDGLHDCLKVSSAFNQQENSNNLHLRRQVVSSSNSWMHITAQSRVQEESLPLHRKESISSWPSSTSKFNKDKDASCTSTRNVHGTEAQQFRPEMYQETSIAESNAFISQQLMQEQSNLQPHHSSQTHETFKTFPLERSYGQHVSNIPKLREERIALVENKQTLAENTFIESNSKEVYFTDKVNLNTNSPKAIKEKAVKRKKNAVDWDGLRQQAQANGRIKERNKDAMDSLDYEAMRNASVNEISNTIKERGMNNMLAERIKDFLDRLVREHGSIDLEWLRDVPPDKAKDYLLSIRGLGLKSVECVRLLTLHHVAFPVDTNVGRIAVRLGWVPLQPLPESLQLHLLELYPVLESIQKYLWPRLCKLDQRTLYELHYQMITFGKVFCTKSRPNCNACPMRAECRHFASAFASARLALPGPEDKSIVNATVPLATMRSPGIVIDPLPLPPAEDYSLKRRGSDIVSCVPIIEEPATPEQEHAEVIESDIEDIFDEDPDEIPTIKLNMEDLTVNVQNYMQANMELQECDMSKALVALNSEVASIPVPKLKNVSRLRTEHQVYELPDSHPLLKGMDKREPDDPSPYLLAIWTPGETANSIQPPEQHCQLQGPDKLCNEQTCFSCSSIREANSQTVRGTLLIPCRTAMQGSFPLNGTYFQVNEVFADHASSLNPIDVPRKWIWNLPRRMVYFGTSVSTIFKGLSTEGIQYCFWKGFVCVRGFDQQTRAPRPLKARLHFPASKLAKTKNETER